MCIIHMGFFGGSMVKNWPAIIGELFDPWVWKKPWDFFQKNKSPQYFYLGNSMDRGAWWAPVHGVTKELDTT